VNRRDRGARRESAFSAISASSAVIGLLAAIFLALHLPYLPKSLEDLDSINFALGVRQFDVAHHQPHPPGYPVYIALAKIVHAAVPDEARALGLVSVVAGGLGVLAIGALFVRLERFTGSMGWVPATALALTSPLYWFTAVRPLSDMPGLAAAVGVQALTLGAATARGLYVASFCAGLATGLRSQVAWLTVPLLIARGLGTCRPRSANLVPSPKSLVPSPQSLIPLLMFCAGALVWAVPLVLITGGPAAYWHALFDQGAEDLGNIQMLWTRHGARDVADALYYAFIASWAAWPLASIVLACIALGTVWLWRHARQTLATLAVAFGPYLVFDVLFQETFTSRYALPLVVPMAYLAAAGLRWAPRRAVWLLALPIVVFDVYVGGTAIAAYARQKAPAFRLLDDMARAALATEQRPVLAPDRRESFDLRRPILWMGAAMPPIVKQLPSPPQHEWLEAVRYWNAGGRDPVWFLVDPRRSAIDLVQHGSPFEYRWPLPYPVLMSGVRPNDVDWYPVDQPEWYVGEGWALTPEAAGVAETDRRDLAHGSIDGWINDRTLGGVLMIGGRNFEPSARHRLTVVATDQTLIDEPLSPGAFLRFVQLPPRRDGSARVEYLRLAVGASASNVAIEQFDASSRRVVFGFGAGWHEQEFNPRTGARWRWLSERGELPFSPPTSSGLALHLEGESPLKYFSRASHLTVRAADRVVFSDALSSDFSLTIPLPPATGPIVLETDQTYVPAEHGWRRTADRRHLGLRIFKVELRPAP
jgi:hypothetical protein